MYLLLLRRGCYVAYMPAPGSKHLVILPINLSFCERFVACVNKELLESTSKDRCPKAVNGH